MATNKKNAEKQPQYIYTCSECGSEDVEMRLWVRPNDGDKLAGNDCPESEDCWCNECQAHYSLDITEETESKSNSDEIK